MNKNKCVWTWEAWNDAGCGDGDYYNTSCGEEVHFEEGEHKYKTFKFCHLCGKEIEEVKEEEEVEDE